MKVGILNNAGILNVEAKIFRFPEDRSYTIISIVRLQLVFLYNIVKSMTDIFRQTTSYHFYHLLAVFERLSDWKTT
jgi:hypothetical protein